MLRGAETYLAARREGIVFDFASGRMYDCTVLLFRRIIPRGRYCVVVNIDVVHTSSVLISDIDAYPSTNL